MLAHRAWVVRVSSQRASDCAAAPAAFLRAMQAGYGLQQARTARARGFSCVAASIGVLGAMRSRFCCARRYATLGATLFLLDRQARKCDPRDFQKAARGV